ncbi:MAG: hypothetical protein Q4G69_12730 [Planctomycetia bacterium]|nr:hypothetical protein [Planctomycetia bacterium]
MIRKINLSLLLLCGVILFTSCEKSNLPQDLPGLCPCTITITQEGTPANEINISFIPENPTKWIPFGSTNESGQAVVCTNGKYRGAPEGKYKLVLTKEISEKSKLGECPPIDDVDAHDAWMEKAAKEKRAVYSSIASKYTNIKTTDLEIDIRKGENQNFSFEIGPEVNIKIR